MKVEIKFNSKLTEIERNLSIPVQKIGEMLAMRMVDRIERGQAASGTFRPLGADSKESPGNGLFWVSPSRAQPAGYVVKAKTGPLTGWAGYQSYKAYTEALGSPPRTFKLTRQLLNSLKMRVMGPGRVKITFYGAHKRTAQPPGIAGGGGANTNIAFLASREERDPMLMPSLAEVREARDLMRAHFESVIEAASAQGAKQSRRRPRA